MTEGARSRTDVRSADGAGSPGSSVGFSGWDGESDVINQSRRAIKSSESGEDGRETSDSMLGVLVGAGIEGSGRGKVSNPRDGTWVISVVGGGEVI